MGEFDPSRYAGAVVDITLPSRIMRLSPADAAGTGFPFETPVHVVSASNPGCELPAEENAARHAGLVAAVRLLDIVTLDAVGRDTTSEYAEASVVLVGLSDDEALALGRRFGQDAIFRWSADSVAIMDCTTEDVFDRGWTLSLPLTI